MDSLRASVLRKPCTTEIVPIYLMRAHQTLKAEPERATPSAKPEDFGKYSIRLSVAVRARIIIRN